MYRNKDGRMILDESYDSDEYDYLNQDWYKQIIVFQNIFTKQYSQGQSAQKHSQYRYHNAHKS